MKSLDNLKNEVLFSHMDETIAAGIFEGKTYPWEVLADIGAFILELGKTLSADEYDRQGEDVWIARSARVYPWTGNHWKKCRSKTLCFYPGKCDCRRRCRGRKFHGTEKCSPV